MTETLPVRTGRHANTSLVVLFLSLGGLAFAVLQSLVAPALPVIGQVNNCLRHTRASTTLFPCPKT